MLAIYFNKFTLTLTVSVHHNFTRAPPRSVSTKDTDISVQVNTKPSTTKKSTKETEEMNDQAKTKPSTVKKR